MSSSTVQRILIQRPKIGYDGFLAPCLSYPVT